MLVSIEAPTATPHVTTAHGRGAPNISLHGGLLQDLR